MTSKETFNGHTLVDFDNLSLGNADEIGRLEKAFRSNGWCFIRFPNHKNQLVAKLEETQTILSAFFAQHPEDKSKYESSNPLGYSRVDHKEGIKVLADQQGLQLQDKHSPLATDVERILQSLALLMGHYTAVIKSIILNLPLLAQSSTRELVQLSPLGMLDIVHYFNERTGPAIPPPVGLDTHEVNCVPHFDPGLFSLSILSTCEGLQLQDQTTEAWIDGPDNTERDQRCIGIIWLGEAASIMTQNGFKAGIHRVIYPRTQHKPRLTVWQEVCTVEQIETVLQPDDNPILLPGHRAVQLVNQSKSKPLRVRPDGEKMSAFMKRVEIERGLSMSKSDPGHFRLLDTNEDQHVSPTSNVNKRIPANASVRMKNQSNSVPLQVGPQGEATKDFMKRMEKERGLSMSKSGVEHMQISVPVSKSQESDPPKKSLLSRIFK